MLAVLENKYRAPEAVSIGDIAAMSSEEGRLKIAFAAGQHSVAKELQEAINRVLPNS